MANKQTTSDGYMPKSKYIPKPVQEGDVRYNSVTKRNEKYSPEGKWIPISSKIVLPPMGKEPTDRAKEWGFGMWKNKKSNNK